MGTHDTNDDGAMGLPLVALGPDSTRRLAVIRDEQRMADLFAELALFLPVVRDAQTILYAGSLALPDARRDMAARLSRAADSLESAISRANGGAA